MLAPGPEGVNHERSRPFGQFRRHFLADNPQFGAICPSPKATMVGAFHALGGAVSREASRYTRIRLIRKRSARLLAVGEPLPIRQLSATELAALLASGPAVELVDVRTEEERAIATIDGSRLLDQAYHDALLLLDRDTPMVFQCHHGVRSQSAAEYFRQIGFTNLCNLIGGIDAWSLQVDRSVPRY